MKNADIDGNGNIEYNGNENFPLYIMSNFFRIPDADTQQRKDALERKAGRCFQIVR